MLIKRADDLKYSDITPKEVYLNRRKFLAGAAVAGGALLAGRAMWDVISPGLSAYAATTPITGLTKSPFSTTEKQNTYREVTTYNNFYEFGSDKGDPARNSGNFVTSPWTVSVEGEVSKPRKFTMDELMKLAPLEERIYRHRCVEAWSIVVPWIGYSFSALAKIVQPKPSAKYVAFQSFYDSKQMPWAHGTGISFPYIEGLRLDEAMNPLTLLTVGMYGQTLPNQDGAPIRMVIPWKYGFKSIKSIIKIEFVTNQPPTTWNNAMRDYYGFYSNVNPKKDNPGWSQAKERRLGELLMRPTLMFNGYGDQVASLYSGMDLNKYY
ncbi:MAG TPA: protein-methionine-sulfoxide reductase catalytic subunit MsrP [Candidatus Acidoferrales bacterium]|jgi:sulfoxide reductase catalytic subunit YedY|nr:protein-methionine-sulfoxide reductase catalytic subunit MsrP [Candidatus Acidoferrales bacterium]